METHPNSHIVYIRRKGLFDTEARPELEEYFSGSSVSVGSYFAKGTARPGSGLMIPEENLLLPYVLAIPADDQDFRTKVNEFYSNIDSKVPADQNPPRTTDGLALEIGLYKDNSKPISATNLPLNVGQYLKYRQIILHPWVGIDESEKGNQLKRFYVFDPNKVQSITLSANEQKDAALTKYLMVKGNARTVRMYLTLLGVNTSTLKPGEELNKLRSLAETQPAEFIKIANDKDKEMRYIIEDMVHYKIVEKVGDRLLSDGTVLGRDMREAILFLSDSHNTAVFTSLKAKLQNAWVKNSVSVETEEDLKPKENPETDAELEKRLGSKVQEATHAAIDTTAKVKAKNQPKAEPVPEPEPQKATGLDIETEPAVEPEGGYIEGGLGDIDAGTSEDDIVSEGEEAKPVNDGRAKEPTPDKIK